jgi:penicillin-binding protein 1B
MPKPKSKGTSARELFFRSRDRVAELARAHPKATRYIAITAASLFVVFCGLTGYYYVTFSRMIDARLHGERDRVLPRVFARPLEIRRGDNISQKELLDRLNDLGYAQRTQAESPGEFAVTGALVSVVPRAGSQSGKTVTVSFQRPVARRTRNQPPVAGSNRIEGLSVGKQAISRVTMDAPMLTALIQARVKRRQVPLSALPTRMVNAVLAIEDQRYYSHPGVDPIRIIGALVTNVFGSRPYLEGASTITQQLSRNFFLTEEMAVEQQTRQRSIRRKLLEQFMAVVLSIKTNKDEVLELYLNDVYLGNRGSFAIHGVAEAARLYFGKDVNNLTLGEARWRAAAL